MGLFCFEAAIARIAAVTAIAVNIRGHTLWGWGRKECSILSPTSRCSQGNGSGQGREGYICKEFKLSELPPTSRLALFLK